MSSVCFHELPAPRKGLITRKFAPYNFEQCMCFRGTVAVINNTSARLQKSRELKSQRAPKPRNKTGFKYV